MKSIFSNVAADIDLLVHTVKVNIFFCASIIAILFVIHFINKKLNFRLNYLGIYPGSVFGLSGIFFSPFLHGDFNHLFFNCFPLFALMNMLLLSGKDAFLLITFIIMVIGGILIWLFGRKSLHVGSSMVILGYFGYLATQSYMAPSFISVLLIAICLYYFGGLVISLFPSHKKEVSWEGHIFGFIGGICAYFLTPKILNFL